MKAPQVAIDIESNGFFRYRERVCLVQLAAAGTAFLVDPLTIEDVQPLGDLLRDKSVEKVFHSADYDLRSLDRDWGFRVGNLFDTSIAAAFVGSKRLGLQSVLHEYADVELAKRRKIQRSDWSLRPLSPEALRYAANDVLHLQRAREALSTHLKKLSRMEWVKEEFARLEKVRHTPPNRALAFLAIKGSRSLDGRGLAILRSLCQFREREAGRLDRPLFRLMSDSALVQLSSQPDADFSTVKGLGRYGRLPASRGLKAAVDAGIKARSVNLPNRAHATLPLSPAERKRVRKRLGSLKMWRRHLGQELRLNPGLLWPAVSLERLARYLGGLDTELSNPKIRNWQKHEFGETLRGFLATLD